MNKEQNNNHAFLVKNRRILTRTENSKQKIQLNFNPHKYINKLLTTQHKYKNYHNNSLNNINTNQNNIHQDKYKRYVEQERVYWKETKKRRIKSQIEQDTIIQKGKINIQRDMNYKFQNNQRSEPARQRPYSQNSQLTKQRQSSKKNFHFISNYTKKSKSNKQFSKLFSTNNLFKHKKKNFLSDYRKKKHQELNHTQPQNYSVNETQQDSFMNCQNLQKYSQKNSTFGKVITLIKKNDRTIDAKNKIKIDLSEDNHTQFRWAERYQNEDKKIMIENDINKRQFKQEIQLSKQLQSLFKKKRKQKLNLSSRQYSLNVIVKQQFKKAQSKINNKQNQGQKIHTNNQIDKVKAQILDKNTIFLKKQTNNISKSIENSMDNSDEASNFIFNLNVQSIQFQSKIDKNSHLCKQNKDKQTSIQYVMANQKQKNQKGFQQRQANDQTKNIKNSDLIFKSNQKNKKMVNLISQRNIKIKSTKIINPTQCISNSINNQAINQKGDTIHLHQIKLQYTEKDQQSQKQISFFKNSKEQFAPISSKIHSNKYKNIYQESFDPFEKNTILQVSFKQKAKRENRYNSQQSDKLIVKQNILRQAQNIKQKQKDLLDQFTKAKLLLEYITCSGEVASYCSEFIGKKNDAWLIPSLLFYNYCQKFTQQYISIFQKVFKNQLCTQIEFNSFVQENVMLKQNLRKIIKKANKKSLMTKQIQKLINDQFSQIRKLKQYYHLICAKIIEFLSPYLKMNSMNLNQKVKGQKQTIKNEVVCGLRMIVSLYKILKTQFITLKPQKQEKKSIKLIEKVPEIDFQNLQQKQSLTLLNQYYSQILKLSDWLESKDKYSKIKLKN